MQPASAQTSLYPVRSVATGAVVWATVGVGVAAIIVACRVLTWVIFAIPDMAVTAVVLGAAQGLWLYLAGRPAESMDHDFRWFGSVTGGVLGLLGLPPVLSRMDGVVVDGPLVAFSLLAAVCGGIAAGFVLTKVVAVPLRGPRPTWGRATVIGCLLVLPLAALDYHFWWRPMLDRLPVFQSLQGVTNLPAGNARGSAWAGCYEYRDNILYDSNGSVGTGGGLLKVTQANGALEVVDPDGHRFHGGVDSDGRFRFGGESDRGEYTRRQLWEGKFHGNSFDFTERVVVLRGPDFSYTERLWGTLLRRSSCPF